MRHHLPDAVRDFVAVLRFQGPRANGMPELHALTPALANLQDAGRHVALVTDGRMSGASGKVPAAIHVSPEILAGGPLGLVRDGDIIEVVVSAPSRAAAITIAMDQTTWPEKMNSTAAAALTLKAMACLRAFNLVSDSSRVSPRAARVMTPSPAPK